VGGFSRAWADTVIHKVWASLKCSDLWRYDYLKYQNESNKKPPSPSVGREGLTMTQCLSR